MKSKKLIIPIISSIVIAGVGVTGTYYGVNQYNEKSQITALRQEVAKLKDKYEKAKQEIETQRSTLQSTINKIKAELESTIEQSNKNLENLVANFNTLRSIAKYEITKEDQDKPEKTYYLAYYEGDQIKASETITTSLKENQKEIPELKDIKEYKDVKEGTLKDKVLPEKEAEIIIKITKDLLIKTREGFGVLIEFLNDKKNEYDLLISKLDALKQQDFYDLLKVEGLNKNAWDALDEAEKIQKIKDALTNKNDEIAQLINIIEQEAKNLKDLNTTAQSILDRLQGKKKQ
ncbi:hypothetical protein [Mycoplasma sp. HU2014]|uniref:hypothetical protein n=1 Tax=Mycoplasma sp. HU2014 TaxID=1664275 RepID=UPI00067BF442|nr:hypothetical protein [Mycoplasma sp. HU2014]KNG79589.1 hypothetical protein AB668_01215 [Mycoplasma sp. HU2014]